MNGYAVVSGVFGPKKAEPQKGVSLCGSNYSLFLVAWAVRIGKVFAMFSDQNSLFQKICPISLIELPVACGSPLPVLFLAQVALDRL